MLLKEYFPDSEMVCPCGCGLMPPRIDVEKLYALRIICDFPLPISSAARCKKHNAAVGGRSGSTHLPAKDRIGESKNWGGQGFDISPLPDYRYMIVIENALKVGFKGFGFKSNMLHIDTSNRPDKIRWNY